MIDPLDSLIYLDIHIERGVVFIKFTPKQAQNFMPIIDNVKFTPVPGYEGIVNVAKIPTNPEFQTHVVTMVPVGLNMSGDLDVLPYHQDYQEEHPSKLRVNFTGQPRFFSLYDGGQFTNWDITGINRFLNCRAYQNQPTYGVLDLNLITNITYPQYNSYTVDVVLDWPNNNADLDVYGRVDANPACYWGDLSSGGLTLNHDAHPTCSPTPMQPELMTGVFTDSHDFKFWYNQYSNCQVPTTPTITSIRITNNGNIDIVINGTTVTPGDSYDSTITDYQGYATGDIHTYVGGTDFDVVCSVPSGGSEVIEHILELSLNDQIIASGSRDGDGEITLVAAQFNGNSSGVSGTVDFAASGTDTQIADALFITQFPDDYTIYLSTSPDVTAENPVAFISDDGHSSTYQYSTDDIEGSTYYALVRQRFNGIESTNDTPAIIELNIVPNTPGRPSLTDNQYIVFEASSTPDVSYNIYDSVATQIIPLIPTYNLDTYIIETDGNIAIDINTLNSVGTAFTGFRFIVIRAVSPATPTGETGTEGGPGGVEDGSMQTLSVEYVDSEIISIRPTAPAIVSANIIGRDVIVEFFQSLATVRMDKHTVSGQPYKVDIFLWEVGSEPDFDTPNNSELIVSNQGLAVNQIITGTALTNGHYYYALRSIALGEGTGAADVQSAFNPADVYGPILLTAISTPQPFSFGVQISG